MRVTDTILFFDYYVKLKYLVCWPSMVVTLYLHIDNRGIGNCVGVMLVTVYEFYNNYFFEQVYWRCLQLSIIIVTDARELQHLSPLKIPTQFPIPSHCNIYGLHIAARRPRPLPHAMMNGLAE